MTNMRKFAAALVLGLVLCLAIFSAGASARSADDGRGGRGFGPGFGNGFGNGFISARQHVRANAVAVARDNNLFDQFGNFGGMGGFGFGNGFPFGNVGGAFARAHVNIRSFLCDNNNDFFG